MPINFDYNKICRLLFQDLPERTREVISRRFGLKEGRRETLEAIGKNYGITRERVRQLERDGFLKMRPLVTKFQETVDYFNDQLKATGGLRKEDVLLDTLGGGRFKNHVFLLLTLADPFVRFPENKDFYSLWALEPQALYSAQKVVASLAGDLERTHQPIALASYPPPENLTPQALSSYLEVSKLIQRGPEGLFGLKDWPEINPRGVKDKAYLVLKQKGKPLHFLEVARGIAGDALPQTVHNELIKDPRFVLVGRGLYGLREWGYEPGTVKDIIVKVLKDAKTPLSKEEIISAVLKQRFVKANTILLNLGDKKYFLKAADGKYTVR